jgi:hypothetical protein
MQNTSSYSAAEERGGGAAADGALLMAPLDDHNHQHHQPTSSRQPTPRLSGPAAVEYYHHQHRRHQQRRAAAAGDDAEDASLVGGLEASLVMAQCALAVKRGALAALLDEVAALRLENGLLAAAVADPAFGALRRRLQQLEGEVAEERAARQGLEREMAETAEATYEMWDAFRVRGRGAAWGGYMAAGIYAFLQNAAPKPTCNQPNQTETTQPQSTRTGWDRRRPAPACQGRGTRPRSQRTRKPPG